MIVCEHNLIPYGVLDVQSIGKLTIANIGRNPDGTCNYLVHYFEESSYFSDEIDCWKDIRNYDRNQPLLELMSEIYARGDWGTREDAVNVHGENLIKHLEIKNE